MNFVRELFVAFAATAVALAGISAARAGAVYDFTPTSTTGSSGQAIDPFSVVLTLDNGFTANSFSRTCQAGCSSTGNFADFSIAYYYGSHLLGTLNDVPDSVFEMTHGTLSANSGSVVWDTSMNTISLTFGNGTWNAHFNSDYPALGTACAQTGCNASGTFDEVPEPGTLWVLGLGVAAVIRQRRRG